MNSGSAPERIGLAHLPDQYRFIRLGARRPATPILPRTVYVPLPPACAHCYDAFPLDMIETVGGGKALR
jgi:hypothetical protein